MPKVAKKCLPKDQGSVLAKITRTDESLKKKLAGKALSGVKVTLLPDNTVATTGSSGTAQFKGLTPGPYSVQAALKPNQTDKFEIVQGTLPAVVAGGGRADVDFSVNRLASLSVKLTDPAAIVGAVVTASGTKVDRKTTVAGGIAAFGRMPIGDYQFKVTFPDGHAQKHMFPAETDSSVALARDVDLEHPIVLAGKKSAIHIQLDFSLPDDSKHPLAPGLPVRLRLDDKSIVEAKSDAKGMIVAADGAVLEVARNRKFTLEFPVLANAWVVFEKAGEAATQELIIDAVPKFGSKLGTAMEAGKRAFRWGTAECGLAQLDISADPAANFTAPDFGFTDGADTIGTPLAPVKLTIKPKWQYIRFEYFDRKYVKSHHGDKPVGTPAVLLRAMRRAKDGTLSTIDAAGNFTVNDADQAKSCQALPWLITKAKDGAALPDLDKDMLLEFGQADAWIESTSEAKRAIVKLDLNVETDKAKTEANKDRSRYYDLPKLWKSWNYYTRLPGDKGKFFDELTTAEIKESYDAAKPLVFSLDDIVLVDKAGGQKVQDKKKDNTALATSKHSRFAMLWMDPDDKYNLKVFDPEDNGFHSKGRFVKESAADKYRNYIIAYPNNPRAVAFCNGFHHILDKRTEGPDYALKQVLGARAAKLDDETCSCKTIFNKASDVTDGYVHRERNFDQHFLNYGATDGKVVYHAMVSFWSTRLFCMDADAPGNWDHAKAPLSNDYADLRHYRDEGMKRAMARWNGKGYQFELADKKPDIVVKPFFLFEAKDIEEPAGTFVEAGGGTNCLTGLSGLNPSTGREIGSWATDTTMYMRRSGYKDEGSDWGDAPNEALPADYALPGTPRCALAHELGHAVLGLWDDYITQMQMGVPSFKAIQRYPGVPFYRDIASMMSPNQTVRLRHFWGRARWMNAEGKSGKALHKFLKEKAFHPTYAPAGKDKLVYFLPDSTNSFWKPSHTQVNVDLGEKGKSDLHLYPLGTDEFSALLPDGPWDGMLLIDTRIQVEFIKGLEVAPLDWAVGTAFVAGQVADYDAEYYVCKTPHTAATFSAEAAHWQKLDPDTETPRVVGAIYNPGQILSWLGNHYVVLTAHTAAPLAADLTAAKLIQCNAKTRDWPTDDPRHRIKTAWAGDIKKGIAESIEGTEGKFRFTRDGDGFTKIYLRPFPQFFFPQHYTEPNPLTAGTSKAEIGAQAQYKIKVRYTASKGFGPKGSNLTVSSGAVPNTVTRYLYGRLSEDPVTRATQTPVADLTAADLAKMKDWVDGKVGGAQATEKLDEIPVVDSIAPADGESVGGTVVLTGKRFTGATKVSFGKTDQAAVTVDSDNRITVVVPAGAVTCRIKVTAPKGGGTAQTDYKILPRITAIAPAKPVLVEAEIVLTGTSFLGATSVKVKDIEATFTVDSETKITAKVPQGATTGRVEVTTAAGKSISDADVKVLIPPTIKDFLPLAAKVGEAVTLNGTDLADATEVKIGGKVAVITTKEAGKIIATVGAGAADGTVEVTTPAGTVSHPGFMITVPVPLPIQPPVQPMGGAPGEGAQVVV